MRKIVLEERPVNTRGFDDVKLFTLKEIESHFSETLLQVLGHMRLAEMLKDQGLVEESENILRSQIVLIEGAYDYYLHELLRLGIVKLFAGEWKAEKKKYYELQIPMKFLEIALEDEGSSNWLKEWITEKYSHVTLMDYPQLKEVCEILGISMKDVAELAFYRVASQDKPEHELEKEIRETYSRRNQIAHQSDRKMGTAERESISCEYVEGRIKCVRKIVLALSEVARRKSGHDERSKKVGSWMRKLQRKLIDVLRLRIVKLVT